MHLKLYIQRFKPISLNNVTDIVSYGSIDGKNQMCETSFRTNKPYVHLQTIRDAYEENEYYSFDDLVTLRTEFDKFESNRIPKITIKYPNGSAGLLDAPFITINENLPS